MMDTVSARATSAWRLYQLTLLATASFAAAYGRFMLGPLQETLRISLRLTDNEIAWLQGPALAIPMALGAIPMGLLVDRYSRARLLILCAVLNLAAAVLTAFAPSFPLLFAARSVAGLASVALLIALYSALCDLYPPAQRGRCSVATSMGESGGPPAAFALGGVLLMMGSSATVGLESWRWAMLWMCTPLLAVVLLLCLLREPRRTGVNVKNLPVREAWPQLWRYRTVLTPLLLGRIMVWIGEGAILAWGAPTLARNFALSPQRIGAIMATALLVAGIAGPMLGGLLADWCQRSGGPRRTVTAMCALAFLSIPAALFALMPNATLAALMLGMFLTLAFISDTGALPLATIIVPGELRGLCVGVFITAGTSFLIGVAPLAVSSLSGALGGPPMLGKAMAIVCSVTSILAGVIFGWGRRNFVVASINNSAQHPPPPGAAACASQT